MNKIIMASAIAALLSSAAPAALAQGDTSGTSGNAGAAPAASSNSDSSGNANNSSTTTHNDMGGDSYSTVMESIQNAADLDLSSITDQSKITIVKLSSIMENASGDMAKLDETMVSRASEQEGLHTRIKQNNALTSKLEAEGHDVEDVISIRTKSDGAVTVYVDDRS